jgi:hypothetical protein
MIGSRAWKDNASRRWLWELYTVDRTGDETVVASGTCANFQQARGDISNAAREWHANNPRSGKQHAK